MATSDIKVALFNVGISLESLILKYGIQTPLNSHDRMVINLWYTQMFERVMTVYAKPHPSVYDFSPLYPPDLNIINDTSFDHIFTKTVKWEMMHKCINYIGPSVTVRLSASTLIVEF